MTLLTECGLLSSTQFLNRMNMKVVCIMCEQFSHGSTYTDYFFVRSLLPVHTHNKYSHTRKNLSRSGIKPRPTKQQQKNNTRKNGTMINGKKIGRIVRGILFSILSCIASPL